jgi:UDP:flavonoid glycosyltransferase YjiC (YdhE family)
VYSVDALPWAPPASVGEIRFLDGAFDLASVASTCDLAITNGNHGVTAAVLLAGKPVLVIPTVTEQYLLGQRLEAFGGGATARPDNLDAVIGGLLRLLRDEDYRNSARRFQARYATIGSEQAVADIAATIDTRRA